MIHLDKIQGDFLYASTDSGKITTNSCFVNSAIFQTNSGNLSLHNVHKNAEINVLQNGRLEMTGFNGTLNANVNGQLKVQLSEIYGNNSIIANGSQQIEVYISDLIENNSFVDVKSKKIEVESIQYVCGKKVFNEKFALGESSMENRLSIESEFVKFGKMNWIDCLKLKMSMSK